MSNDIVHLTTSNDVGLPLDVETFSRVILDFLGRKENLSYTSKHNFVINLNDISQFHNIIKTKISYQKNIILEHFSVNFIYSNGTSREINGEEALEKFLETRFVDVLSVNLNWKIIIKFDNSPSIETQEINLLFSTEKRHYFSNNSYIKLSINHTNQSWALDILSAFEDKINEVTIKESKFEKILKSIKETDWLFGLKMSGLLLFVLTMSLSYALSEKSLKKDLINHVIQQNHTDNATKIIDLLEITGLDKKEIILLKSKDKEIQKIVDESKKDYIVTLILLLVVVSLPFIISKYVNYSIKYLEHKSFITISNISMNNLQEYRNSKNKVTYISLTVIISSVFFSLIASVIYSVFSKIFI